MHTHICSSPSRMNVVKDIRCRDAIKVNGTRGALEGERATEILSWKH